MEIISYNIHDLLQFRVNRQKGFLHDAVKDMRMHFQYFRSFSSPSPQTPHLQVNIGPFTPDKSGCRSIDRKYYVKQGYLYFKERFRRLFFEVEIRDWENDAVTVNFHGDIFGLKSLLAPNVIINDHIIQPLLEIKFNRMGFCLSHSAAAAINGQAIILSGRGGSRKTSFAMQLLRKGWQLQGDDYILLSGQGEVFAYPTHISVFEYRQKHLQNEEMSLLDKIRARYGFNPTKKYGKESICEQSKGKVLLLLYPCLEPEVSMRATTQAEAVQFLIHNNHLEMMHSPFHFGWQAYSLVFPGSPIADHYRSMAGNLEQALKDFSIFKVYLPVSFKHSHLEEVLRKAQLGCP